MSRDMAAALTDKLNCVPIPALLEICGPGVNVDET